VKRLMQHALDGDGDKDGWPGEFALFSSPRAHLSLARPPLTSSTTVTTCQCEPSPGSNPDSTFSATAPWPPRRLQGCQAEKCEAPWSRAPSRRHNDPPSASRAPGRLRVSAGGLRCGEQALQRSGSPGAQALGPAGSAGRGLVVADPLGMAGHVEKEDLKAACVLAEQPLALVGSSD
jgi:hypothetical protein